MTRFEREFWQATVQFGAPTAVQPTEAARFLTAVGKLELGEMQWQLPAMNPASPSMQLEVGEAGLTPVQPDFVIGASPEGWIIRLSSRQLVIRHQEMVKDGKRQLRPEQFPDRQAFGAVIRRVVEALPTGLVARRTVLAVNYAMFTANVYPPSALSELLRNGERCASPPPDGVPFTTVLAQLEFETVDGKRSAWIDLARIGNWFDSSGQLFSNAGIVKMVEVKTASEEPATPARTEPSIDTLPALLPDDVLAFFDVGGPFGLGKAIDRIRRSLPEGVEIDE